jgi:pimeloyl-ACP methyl ester carboxylesterase
VQRTPKVAFFPGASGAGEFWRSAADRLPEDWETYLLSWPGAGAQPHDPSIRGYQDLVGLAAAAIENQSDVVAQSMGGVVAIGLAVAHPQKIRRLVLVATSGGIATHSLGAQDWRRAYQDEFPDAAPWIIQQNIDYTQAIATITAPTCLIWGDADSISPLAVGQQLHERLPSSTLHVLSGGTHNLGRDRPGEVATLIIDHLR